jgi:SAM-dependent methyltransferase
MTEVPVTSRKRQRTNGDELPSWFLYPPTCQKFHEGQAVLFRTEKKTRTKNRGYRKGTILEVHSKRIIIQDFSSKENIVIDGNDQSSLVLPDMRAFSEQTILVTPETKDFRHLTGLITSNDRVLEIGCSSGEASLLMVSTCQSWVGFDTSEEMLEKCKTALQSASSRSTKESHPVIMNALVDCRKARDEACRFGLPTTVVCDIGGNRELFSVLRMLSWVFEEFEPRFILIKSRELMAALQSSSATIDAGTGLINKGHAWFQENRQKHAMPKHPQKAPMVMSPVDPERPICRYHNYHKNGCKKNDCHLDHDHCHFCLEKGHVAKECPHLSASSSRKSTTSP